MKLLLLLACRRDPAPAPLDTAPETVPWSSELPPLAAEIGDTRGMRPARAIVHLHSPWSHDACDGGEGAENPECLADLREGLCRTAVDVAFLTDHPAYAAWHPYEELFQAQEGDEPVLDEAGAMYANRVICEDGHVVQWQPGIEDELMPVGLARHVSEDPDEADALYNGYDATTLAQEQAAGAMVLNRPHRGAHAGGARGLAGPGAAGHGAVQPACCLRPGHPRGAPRAAGRGLAHAARAVHLG